MTQNLQAIQDDYPIGMNDRYPTHLLPRGMYSLLQNVTVDQNKFVKRKGTNPIAPTLGAFSILGLSAYQPAGGAKYLIGLLNGSSNAQLYSWAGSGSFSAIGSANITKDLQMNFVQASNRIYGFNGLEAVTLDSSLTYTHNPTSVPKGNYAAWFHNYLFVANTTGNPNRLYFSALGDPTNFDGSVAGAVINSGGVGYTVGDVLSINGSGATPATVSVTSVSSGVITGVSLLSAGSGYLAGNGIGSLYVTTANTNLATGSGATFNITINSSTANNFVDINPNDGDMITGLAVFNDQLYVFKNNTIWAISGFSGISFAVTTIAGQNTNNKIYGYGCPSQKSIVVTGKDMYYLSFLGGIPHFRSFLQTQYATTLEQGIVSYDIEGTMTTINRAQLPLIAGAYDGKYVYWAIPTGSNTYNDTVLAFYPTISVKGTLMKHRSWATFSGFTPAQFATSSLAGQQTVYFGDGQATGLISQMNYAAYADGGTPVIMIVNSRDVQFDKAKKAKFKYMYLFYKTGSAGTLRISARVDDTVDFSSQYVLPLTGNSPGLGPTGNFTLGVSVLGGSTTAPLRVTFTQMIGHHLMFQLKESTANFCEVDNLVILGKMKGYRAS